jgi:hypothetical protein
MYLNECKPYQPSEEDCALQRINQLKQAKKDASHLFDKVAFNTELQKCIDILKFRD